ncbi:MAG: ABC transporter permease [Clostridiales bacterium]|nr:ABC transporter permease [Clostridiales bacterium]MBR3843004.1 ABC transporter permease [Christensenellaceae bacterium]
MKKFIKNSYISLLLLFLYIPILMLMVFSFNEGKTMSKWTGFSLKWYVQLFNDPNIADALTNTLSIAFLSAIISTIIGTLAAIGINECKKSTQNLILNFTYVPMVNADIVTGVSMLLLFIFLRIPRGYGTLLISHIAFNTPYVIFSILPRLRQLDPHLYEAALDMGATPVYAIWKVTIPQLMPSIITGAILAFTMSFDDFVISFFSTQGMVNNLPIYIYSMAKVGINPKINALSVIMFLCVMTLLVITNLRSMRADKQAKKNRQLANRSETRHKFSLKRETTS